MVNPESFVGQWDGSPWDAVADVIVAGTGIAGAAAAVAAAQSGASVLVLDKAALVGGTTALSGGAVWIPNNFSLRARGCEDDRDQLLRYMARSAYPSVYRDAEPALGLAAEDYDMIAAFYDEAAGVVDELIAGGALELEALDIPDYYSDLPEATAWGHALAPTLPAHWRRGGPAGGELIVEQLLAAAQRHRAQIMLKHQVVDLVNNTDDEVIGVQVRRGRERLLLGARKGVVFATGGFLHDARLVEDFLRWPPMGGVASPNSTGDFVRIAAAAGARLSAMNQAWWDQVVVELAVRNRHCGRDVFHAYGDAMIMVNNRGDRVLNEKSPYSERGQTHHFWDSGRHDYPNRVLFMIFDDSVHRSESRGLPAPAGTRTGRFPVPYPDESPDYMISAESWQALSSAIAQRLSALSSQIGTIRLADDFATRLQRTVDEFSSFAIEGSDPRFHRGRTAIEKAWEIEGSKYPNASMAPFGSTGPYHCIMLGPGALDTKGGPRIDPGGHVLNWSNERIPGLFAAGNCAATITGQAYWGPGTTLGQGLTFGYLAGKNASMAKVRSARIQGWEASG